MRACPDTWPNLDAQFLGDRPIRVHGTTQFSISAGRNRCRPINRSGHSIDGRARANGAEPGTRIHMSCTGRIGMLAVVPGALLLALPDGALNFIRNRATVKRSPFCVAWSCGCRLLTRRLGARYPSTRSLNEFNNGDINEVGNGIAFPE